MSDGVPVTLPASLVQGSQAPIPTTVQVTSGNVLPQSGKKPPAAATSDTASSVSANAQQQTAKSVTTPAAPVKPTTTNKSSPPELVQQLNKYLNDSGRANTFRIDPSSRNQTIQEINPSTGEVIGEFDVDQFPALARSLGVSGVLVDSHA